MASLPAPVIDPPALEPLPMDPDEAEVRILYALHQARACLGGGLRVVRADSRQLEVRGIVESAARRTEIATLVSASTPQGMVRIELLTLDELPASQLPGAAAESESSVEPMAGRAPLEAELLRSYRRIFPEAPAEANERRVLALSNQVLRAAGLALDHAWAIRNLALRYPPQPFQDLPSPAGVLVREMVRDHAAALSATCTDLSDQLEAPLAAVVRPEAHPAEAGSFESWQASAAVLLRETQELDDGAHELFSSGGETVEDPAARAWRLQIGLARAAKQAAVLSAVELPTTP